MSLSVSEIIALGITQIIFLSWIYANCKVGFWLQQKCCDEKTQRLNSKRKTQADLTTMETNNKALNKALGIKKKDLYAPNHTFSGRVSTLKRTRPKQSTRTIANDEHKTKVGFLATHVPYLLNTKTYTQCQRSFWPYQCEHQWHFNDL